jgi:hypothetical protein
VKRSPIQRRTPLRSRPKHQPTVEREPKPMALSPATRRGTYAGTVSGQAVDKERPVRSEAYRRLVADLPCACGCGRMPCQAAHPNTGKGMALKTDDRRCFPLAPECHRAFDQGAMFPKDARRQWEERWGAQTRAAILTAGTWPKNLPHYEET